MHTAEDNDIFNVVDIVQSRVKERKVYDLIREVYT
jgi:hypothetical protein